MTQNKQIIFIQDRVPAIHAGTYTITADQHVVIDGVTDEHFSVTRRLEVRGERFTLQRGDIHAVFPPDKTQGPYIGHVPYIMFDRAMLPWLRGLAEGVDDDATWLALLLFDADEMPAVQTLKVRDLVARSRTIHTQTPNAADTAGTLSDGRFSYPFDPPWDAGVCELEYGETAEDGILAIDVPVDLFRSIAPGLDDMSYLAHVREVDLTGRPDSAGRGAPSQDSDALDVGQFATVLGNRVPAVGDAHAVLVSLEGLGQHLPGGQQESALNGYSHVRLVVLKHWRFITTPDNTALLKHALEHLCDEPADPDGLNVHLRIPAAIPTEAEVADALAAQAAGSMTDAQGDVQLRHGFAQGYVPLAHHMRTGGRDISWYRGPLVTDPVRTRLAVPLDSSDAALAYNPETGMFDVSYAAAWQLGQLLALENRQFSAALYAWRLALAEQGAAENDRFSASMAAMAGHALAARARGPAAAFSRLFAAELRGRHGQRISLASENAPPAVVSDWLNGLKQLRGIPLRYLVPHDRMMPSEALRVFRLDTNWINALLDGACSIARSVTGRPIANAPWLFPEGQGVISGYLLNSQVVIAWPGLKLVAKRGDDELTKTYDDYLVPGVRMALFDGDLDRIDIQQSGDGLQFGADYDGSSYTVPLRKLTGEPGKLMTADGRAGIRHQVIHHDRGPEGWIVRGEAEQQPPAISVQAAMRGDRGRVFDVATTAGRIRQGLIDHGALDRDALFTSAEYALELVRSVIHVSYRLDS